MSTIRASKYVSASSTFHRHSHRQMIDEAIWNRMQLGAKMRFDWVQTLVLFFKEWVHLFWFGCKKWVRKLHPLGATMGAFLAPNFATKPNKWHPMVACLAHNLKTMVPLFAPNWKRLGANKCTQLMIAPKPCLLHPTLFFAPNRWVQKSVVDRP